MTIISHTVRTLGLPFVIFLGMLGFYEGIPVVRNIPFIDLIPAIGDLAVGRVEAERTKAASEARAGYVALSEMTALKAQLDKERADRLLASRLYDQAQQLAAAAEQANRVANEKLENTVREDNSQPGGAVWGADDDQWMRDHRGRAD